MRVRKLLDWRKLLIYSHRWLGIVLGVVLVAWTLSGIILLYAGVPHLTAGERLMRLPPLDLSAVHITPADAARQLPAPPFRLRISMHGNRPVYRFNTGRVFGRWTLIYADTGERVAALDRDRAMAWLRAYLPEQRTLRYDAYLTKPDTYTRLPALQTHFPMHRIALDDAAGTEYYVSERSGEAVVKTDRRTRMLGLFGYITHTFFFFRQKTWWSSLLNWLSWIGLLMVLTGAIVGIWRYGLSPRFRHKGVPSRSPYVGWMWWHHYAGLLFGLFTITWVFSGLASLDAIPGIHETLYSKAQIAQGARSVQGQGAILDLRSLTVQDLQAAAATVARSFVPKELELLQFGGEPYLIAYRPPTPTTVDQWESRSAMDFITPTPDAEHVMVAPSQPDRALARFDDATMMRVARASMPGARIRDAAWLSEYDDYYYKTVPSFDLGLPRMAKPLPVLRVRFDDAEQTWLYLTASPGQILKIERQDRANRWGYYGLHGLDVAALYRHRPLWDIVAVVLLIGVLVSSVTSVVPACRRLLRHARKLRPSVRSVPMKSAVMLLIVVGLAPAASAQNADDYRGGWRTDGGEAHTYEFSIRGDRVRGIYCTYCADATTLAFVDGTFGPDGITFKVTYVKADGSTAYTDTATARFDRGRLIVRGTSGAPGGKQFERVLIKDPRGPDPLPVIVSVLPKAPPVPANPLRRNPDGADGLPYILPGPWKSTLTEKDVVGVWLGFGVGSPKQFFIIKKVGNRLRGMVCGTCDNPYTMAALDDFQIQGDTLKFNILHEDWADGELPTFYKHVTAHIGWNEMRCTTSADHQPAPPPRPGVVPGFSLEGPIAIEATHGNVWPEWPPKGTSEPH